MLRILFTSSFKKIPIAFIIAVLAIVGIEYTAHDKLTYRFFYHEVDHLLYNIERFRRNKAEYLFIGDSVGLQLSRQFRGDKKFYVLASNQAVEITGQYFIVKRYLMLNRKPKAVILLSLPKYSHNLEQVYTENFVYRCFNRFDELIEIAKVKLNPAIFIKMLSYKLFPTFKYRLKLQEEIIGFTNSDVYSGVDIATKPSENGDHSLLEVIKKLTKNRPLSSELHFGEFIDYLAKENINFYYISVPLKDIKAVKKTYLTEHDNMINKIFLSLKEKYPHTFFYDPELTCHNPDFFQDNVHYNKKGLHHGEEYIKDKLLYIFEKL